jgi:hypothetical protein
MSMEVVFREPVAQPTFGVLVHSLTGEHSVMSHTASFILGALLLVVIAWQRHSIVRLVGNFFRAKTHPLNLAVVRILLFAVILYCCVFDHVDPTLDEAVWFSQLPSDFIETPAGVRFILKLLHVSPASLINSTWVQVAWWIFLAGCITGLLGLFSRSSSLLVVLSGLYALAIPEFYGKVDHYHHWLWFAALMAVSPCGDALSLDAGLARLRGAYVSQSADICYALPLRFVWLLLGLMYFFPGFWKVWDSGLDWALSDNLKYLMQTHWTTVQREGWKPLMRFDQYPFLYKAGGLFTIAFELSFIFLIFLPRLRPLAGGVGALFHISTWLTMNIFFWDLIVFYASFIDWEALLRRYRKAAPPVSVPRPRSSTILIAMTGGVLIAAVLLFGVRKEVAAWPFACYPTFSGLSKPQVTRLISYRVEADGTVDRIDLVKDLSEKTPVPPHRIHELLRLVLEAPSAELRLARMNALIEVMTRSDPVYRDAKGTQFYRELLLVDPDRQQENPIRREMLFQWGRGGDTQ